MRANNQTGGAQEHAHHQLIVHQPHKPDYSVKFGSGTKWRNLSISNLNNAIATCIQRKYNIDCNRTLHANHFR